MTTRPKSCAPSTTRRFVFALPACWGARWLALTCALAACEAGAPPPEEGAPLSVLLVTIDTLRPDYLSMNGYDRPTTPFLDELLAHGTYFERAVSPIGRTTPAVASILTGAYPHRSGVRTLYDPLSDEVVPWTEVLRELGYQTLAVVSNEVLAPKRRLRRGFDVYDFRGSTRVAAATTATALEYLEFTDPERPLFAWVHYIDPHVPYHSDPAMATAFSPHYEGPYRLNFGWQPRPGEPPSSYRTYPEELPKSRATHRNPLPEGINAHIRRLYAADVRSTDDQLAPLVARFRELYGDRGLIAVTSDHGESLGEHDFYFDHGDYAYDPGTRVPLGVIPPPGHPAAGSRRCGQWVSLVDLAPTLFDLLGAELPEPVAAQFEGRSLVPCMLGGELPSAPVFAESGRAYSFELIRRRVRNDVAGRFRAVTLDGWKLIWTPFQSGELEWELYDVASDPGETRDLYAPDHPRVAELKQHLEDWMLRARGYEENLDLSEADREALRRLGYLD